jgi:hypothetical protein
LEERLLTTAQKNVFSLANNHRNLVTWVTAILLLLGTARFIYDLDGPGLWVDEGWSIDAVGNDLDEITSLIAEDVHPPFYFYLLHLWLKVGGDTVFALRYLTVLTSVLSMAVIYQLGRTLFGHQVGLIAILLFILHDLVIILGQEVRQYPQMQLLAALTMLLYWRFWQKPTMSKGLPFVLSGAILLWTMYWGGFVLLALAIHATFTRPKRLFPFIIANVSIRILFLPWLPTLITQLTGRVAHGALVQNLPSTLSGYQILAFQLLGRPEIFWMILIGVGFFNLGAYRRKPTSASILPGMVIIVTVALSIIINYRYDILHYRALAVVIPSVVVLIAHAISGFRPYERNIIFGIIIALSLTLPDANPPPRLPWNPVAQFVTRHSAQDDLILIERWFDTYPFTYYLEHQQGQLAHLTSEFGLYEDQLSTYDGLWLVGFGTELHVDTIVEQNGLQQTAYLHWETHREPIVLRRYDRIPENWVESFGQILQLDNYTISVRNEIITINMLWAPLTQPDRNYTISIFLLDSNGILIEQNDSYPFDGHSPTLSWQLGGHYFDSSVLSAENLPSGVTYQVGLKVYAFDDASFQQFDILTLDNCDASCEFIILDTIEINQ